MIVTREKVLMADAWLAVLDDLEATMREAGAMLAVDPHDAGGRYRSAAVLDGMRAVHDQAVDMITSLGFRRHDETGVPYDPALHEVIRLDPISDAAPGIVVEVLRPGYGEGEELLRPAAVVVSAGSEVEPTESEPVASAAAVARA